MRVVCLFLTVALLGAAAAPVPPASPATDRLAELLGSWTCRDGANVPSTLTVSRDHDAIVAAEQKALLPDGPSYVETQRYQFDAAKGTWQVEASRPYVHFSGSAPPWTDVEWNVAGTWTYTNAAGGVVSRAPRAIRYVRAGDGPLYRGTPDDGPARVNGEVCVPGSAPPDVALCPAAGVPATTLHVVAPGMTYGETGLVQVIISLDADSHVVGTRVASSTNRSLNRNAEDIARRSTFRTKYRNCHPVPADYLFSFQSN
jgi:hypothetical protein